MQATPKIGLLIDSTQALGRSLLEGVVRYARLHGPWQFEAIARDVPGRLRRLERLGYAAIVAQARGTDLDQALAATRLPTIVLRDRAAGSCSTTAGKLCCEISVDWRAAAALAADHLLERGLRHFAFVGERLPEDPQICAAESGFCERLAEARRHTPAYHSPARPQHRIPQRSLAALGKWLLTLPRPVGILAVDERCGRQVLEACGQVGLAAPWDVAVITIETDDLLCELADPPLSGVALNGAAIGYRAAAALDRKMRGAIGRQPRLTIGPVDVSVRLSTQTLAAGDLQVAIALELIRCHATQPIDVDDIVKRLPISRRAFELRFRKAMGRGPHHELQRVRFDRAQQLLQETDLSVGEIAAATGYSSASYLTQVFQKRVGQSPGQVRRAHRAGEVAAFADERYGGNDDFSNGRRR